MESTAGWLDAVTPEVDSLDDTISFFFIQSFSPWLSHISFALIHTHARSFHGFHFSVATEQLTSGIAHFSRQSVLWISFLLLFLIRSVSVSLFRSLTLSLLFSLSYHFLSLFTHTHHIQSPEKGVRQNGFYPSHIAFALLSRPIFTIQPDGSMGTSRSNSTFEPSFLNMESIREHVSILTLFFSSVFHDESHSVFRHECHRHHR